MVDNNGGGDGLANYAGMFRNARRPFSSNGFSDDFVLEYINSLFPSLLLSSDKNCLYSRIDGGRRSKPYETKGEKRGLVSD